MNKIEFLKFLANAPKNLKGYDELLSYARNLYKQAMGVFPEGIDNISIKQAVKETAENRSKLIQFPPGGKDKGKFGIMEEVVKDGDYVGNIPVTIEGKTKNMSAEGIMDFLMGKGKTKDVNIGKAPKTTKETTKRKSMIDPKLTQEENIKNIMAENKASAKRLQEKMNKQKDFDPEDKADGGRIGFSGGGAGFAGDPMQGDQYVTGQKIPGSPQVPMGQFGPLNVGIFGGGGLSKNEIVPGVNMATTNQNIGITGQIPIGNTGFTLGGDYMKSRTNERFTGPVIPNQVFKNVPVDSDRFNIGINFRKQFKDGSKPKDPGRRGFLKLMGGLAALPFVGKFFKPAAKVAGTAAPVVQEGVKLGFDKFMMLVDKIKRLGKPADDLATQERQRVIRYDGKDGNEYELVEDLTTGNISVTKDRPGVAVYGRGTDDVEGIDVIEDRSTFIYKKGEDIVDAKTGKSKRTPDEYDELQQTSSDPESAFDGIDEIDDKAVNEVLEELGETRIKKSGGGLAYMLGE